MTNHKTFFSKICSHFLCLTLKLYLLLWNYLIINPFWKVPRREIFGCWRKKPWRLSDQFLSPTAKGASNHAFLVIVVFIWHPQTQTGGKTWIRNQPIVFVTILGNRIGNHWPITGWKLTQRLSFLGVFLCSNRTHFSRNGNSWEGRKILWFIGSFVHQW